MSAKDILDNTKSEMAIALDYCKAQISKVRTGRATASLLDGISFEYYGAPTPLSQGATVSVPDARTIIVQPFDRTTLGNIERAIRLADLGFNPQNDGTIIRIPVPPLTEERRKEFVKMCKKFAEEGRVAIRNIRRDQIDALKKLEKSKECSEDERKRGEDEVQKHTDNFIKEVDAFLAKKEKDLMDN